MNHSIPGKITTPGLILALILVALAIVLSNWTNDVQRAILDDDVKGLEKALKDGGKPDVYVDNYRHAILWTAAHDKPDMTRLLIEHGADVNVTSRTLNSSVTPLHLAKSTQVAKLLLEAGAKINAMDSQRKTVLDYALHVHKNKALVDFLKSNNAH